MTSATTTTTKAKSPDDALEVLQEPEENAIPRGAIYHLYGDARRGGEYNGHIMFCLIYSGLTLAGVTDPLVYAWGMVCMALAFLLDERTLKRKVALRNIPAQFFLYAQVVLNAAWNSLPHYAAAFAIYVCIYPLREQWNVSVSSFVMMYGFYMVLRLLYLIYYNYALTLGAERLHPKVFEEQRANLRTRQAALRHVWWTYFLGNVGLIVKCAVQVMTIGLFELLRQQTGLDIETHPTLAAHASTLTVVALVAGVVAFGLSAKLSSTVYYRAHRTFHVRKPLYDSIHAIHHRGILPTPLDSGTISPMEYFITDMARPAVLLLPNWLFVLSEVGLAFGAHLPSHTSGTLHKFGQHHLAHHRYVVYNFGLFPRDDERYGTLFVTEDPATDSA